MNVERDLWPRAKELLLPYDGSTSQLYVLDLPLSCLESTLNKLCDAKADPQAITLHNYTGEPVPFSPEVKETLLFGGHQSITHVLEGNWLTGPELRIWIWIDGPAATFDLEFVFWANSFFPSPEDDKTCVASFSELVAFAETFRALSPKVECVLSASETGDPRHDRGTPCTLFW